jgi:hypothetical protein
VIYADASSGQYHRAQMNWTDRARRRRPEGSTGLIVRIPQLFFHGLPATGALVAGQLAVSGARGLGVAAQLDLETRPAP